MTKASKDLMNQKINNKEDLQNLSVVSLFFG